MQAAVVALISLALIATQAPRARAADGEAHMIVQIATEVCEPFLAGHSEAPFGELDALEFYRLS